MITVSERWRTEEPGACVGLLFVQNAPNMADHPALNTAREDLGQELRARLGTLDRGALRELPIFSAYDAFYRRFRKTYHVQLQLESVIFKGKTITSPSALVCAMFLAELKTGLLTAAHDRELLELPLIADLAQGDETYQRLDGTEQRLKTGDLYIRDQQGVISSVIYGPDQRTQIRSATHQVIYTTYGPTGITKAQVQEELEILEDYLRLFAPQLKRAELVVL